MSRTGEKYRMTEKNSFDPEDIFTAPEPPLILVFSAPSGAGKSTICKHLLKRNPRLVFSVSTTTRPPRSDEEEGVDYHFVEEEKFKQMIEADAFLEWARVHGEYYGTTRQAVLDELNRDKDVMLDIDVQGGEQIRKLYPEAVMIFIVPPDMEELERRLRARNTESESEINQRLANARDELKAIHNYDFVVVNDSVERAVEEVEAIRSAQKCRLSRIKEGLPEL